MLDEFQWDFEEKLLEREKLKARRRSNMRAKYRQSLNPLDKDGNPLPVFLVTKMKELPFDTQSVSTGL